MVYRLAGNRTLWLILWLFCTTAAPAQTPTAPIDRAGLSGLTEAASGLDRIRSLVIAREGEVVYGHTFRGPGLDQPVNIKSLSKTVHSAVVGIAIDRGSFEGTDQPITDLLPAPEGASPRLSEVTVGNLLSMQAGLQRTSGRHYGAWVSSDNWVDYALSREFVAEPGGPMLYSTGSYHILSAALVRATGESLLTLTRRWLGNPLNIRIPDWPTDPQGLHFGGNDMRLSPLALLQIGELYRNGGLHEGKRVLSASWIERSWEERGLSRYTDDRYGYGWFTTTLNGFQAHYGRGYGGQMLYVLPELALTVVVTADPTPPSNPGFTQKLDRLLEKHALPELEEAGVDPQP